MKPMGNSKKDTRESDARDQMVAHIEVKQERKLHARRTKQRGTWFGLGMMGTIGWSVVVPTLLGVALGSWIDAHWSSPISWTLVLLIAGLLVGCMNAWFWIAREQRAMEREREDR